MPPLRFLMLLLPAVVGAAEGGLSISTQFPGGAATLVSADAATQTLTLSTAFFPQGGWRTWWACEVRGLDPTRPLGVRVEQHQRGPARDPVISRDGGRTWGFLDGRAPVQAASARIAWYVPYVGADANAAIAAAATARPVLVPGILTTSEGGRPVPLIRGGNAKGPMVWIQARQHAWEVASSWVADGFLGWLARDPAGAELLARAEVVVVPIMDLDSADTGAGGKDQKPHDHNRDWNDQPHWAAVRAAQAQLKPLGAAGRLAVFLDLHNPGGPKDEVEFWCRDYSAIAAERRVHSDRFLAAFRAEAVAPLPFRGRIEEGSTPADAPTAGRWVRENAPPSIIGGTFEIPVAPPKGRTDPPVYHRELGAQLGRAILRVLPAVP